MRCIVTDIHDPVVLAATCQRLDLPPPHESGAWLDGAAASGWVISLPRLHAPIVCDTLSGLVAYHPRDNVHERYAHIMRFVYGYYSVRAQLQQRRQTCGNAADKHHRPVEQVA